MNTPARGLGRGTRIAWYAVLAMMLVAAAWSISGKLTAWGMDWRLALGLSLMFDLAGLICAAYARRAIERGTPAGLPRLAIFAFVSVSGAINWSHGRQVGGLVAAYGLASISFAVELLFELHRRDVRDEQRAERGLVAERMPHIPLLGWIMYPGRAWATLRGAVGARLDVLDPVQTDRRPVRKDTPGRSPATVRSAVRAVLSITPDASVHDVLDHLDTVGVNADEDTVRAIMDGQQDTKDSRSDGRVRPIAPHGQSVTDTIRTALSSGIEDKDAVVSYVRKIHGDDVPRPTIIRTRTRVLAEYERRGA
ncbi:DUF2637 domain-containing protein [Streptomyces sp. NPDC058674]|uniref:DUF2637 domain-containing protein n=1 Tax=Streptomyces sp. NPDC058674 TaxID=3346592 RepID=UPI00364A0177